MFRCSAVYIGTASVDVAAAISRRANWDAHERAFLHQHIQAVNLRIDSIRGVLFAGGKREVFFYAQEREKYAKMSWHKLETDILKKIQKYCIQISL